jgi:hypothetical protein
LPLGDTIFDNVISFLDDPSADKDSFIRGFILGGAVMALGLKPVVDQVKTIFANKDATIQQLSDRLATANANAILPVDQAAFDELVTAVAVENALPPVP